MKRVGLSFLAVALAGFCLGCEKDYYAKQIITCDTGSGKLALRMLGTGEELMKQKRIDQHHRFLMADKTPIDVWVIKARPGEGKEIRATALLLHGLGESKGTRYLFVAGQRLAKMGYDVVLMDLRAHGRSGGEYVTHGALEKHDVKSVMDSLIGARTVHPNVYVFGRTLGAAVAIQYAAIDPRCKGVVALTPYRDVRSFGRLRLAPLAPALSQKDYETHLARAGEIASFDPEDASAVAAASKLSCPLLLVHALFDLRALVGLAVPVEHSQDIRLAARGPTKLILVTPVAEQIALALILDRWIPDKIHMLATKGLEETATKPAAKPAAKP